MIVSAGRDETILSSVEILVWNAVYTIVRKIKEQDTIHAVVFHPTQKKIIFGG